MRPGIHPAYGPVVFRDKGAGYAFLTRSTATSDKTIPWEDGNTYPVTSTDYKDTALPRTFISDRGKIRSRPLTRPSPHQQRDMARAIKNAHEMAPLPYSSRPGQ